MESPPTPVPRRYDLSCQVDAYRHGWSLLRFLTHRFRYHPEDLWSERVREGAVRVNGEVADAHTTVRRGDRIGYTIVHAEPAVDFTHHILHEDDDLLAVAKSGNLPVHAGGKFIANTLIARLRETYGPELRPAHRLDRETSGVVLFARNADAARHLEREFRERRVDKEYLAVLRGDAPARWTVDAPIARGEPAAPPYFRVVDDASGKTAVTRFERLARADGSSGAVTLVRAAPESGRTNQIRVHAAHSGHPVLGDKIYGVPEDLAAAFVRDGETPELLAAAGAARHLLHCARLRVVHPRTGRPWSAAAPAPDDLVRACPRAWPAV
ncbi:MAG TPA: RluA family pseudouridine synthase, partial [bacterium]|nr:RluA family pseudouridine synthase [bacterium]